MPTSFNSKLNINPAKPQKTIHNCWHKIWDKTSYIIYYSQLFILDILNLKYFWIKNRTISRNGIKSEVCAGFRPLKLVSLLNALSLKGVVIATINSVKDKLLIFPTNGRTWWSDAVTRANRVDKWVSSHWKLSVITWLHGELLAPFHLCCKWDLNEI